MQHQVRLPRLGDTTRSALVTEWLCEVGAPVTVGTPLVTVETDKITTDIPSPIAGPLPEQLVAPQEEVEVDNPICIIES